jgi:hypothetical protein
MENVTDFWEEVSKLLVNPQHEIFYRLYYDDHGNMLFYSMENLPGNYIEIDVETFRANESNIKVRNGKIVRINPAHTFKLVPSDQGTACDTNDVTVVVDATKENCKWVLKNYDSEN